MSKKFTEEQYQKIVKAWQSENTYVHQTEAVIDYLIDDLSVDVTLMGDESLALANPVTREWAHEQFVEKDKKYVWTLKRTAAWNGVENYKRLFRTVNGDISDVLKEKDEDIYEEEYLTETDIKEWGYNPEMFDKEEV